ncbi:hypothetical protein LZ32DRAFT_603721 [Colletotrichum eremochloae]|nr:hypothetical protein LZ32DRAFT_603721 [Colletotrichum eremochloae]
MASRASHHGPLSDLPGQGCTWLGPPGLDSPASRTLPIATGPCHGLDMMTLYGGRTKKMKKKEFKSPPVPGHGRPHILGWACVIRATRGVSPAVVVGEARQPAGHVAGKWLQ